MPKVKSADDMDVETFLKHINARHVPLGKMKHFGKSNVPGDENEDLLRATHRKIHETYDDRPEQSKYGLIEINHTHGEGSK